MEFAMTTILTKADITAIVEGIRAAGIPDSLNRWLSMTPEMWANNVRVRARLSKHAIGRREIKRDRRPSTAGLPRSLDGRDLEAAKGILAEARKEKEDAARAKIAARQEAGKRLARYREQMRKDAEVAKIGKKEAALREARELRTKGGAYVGTITTAKNGTTGIAPRKALGERKAPGGAKTPGKPAKGTSEAR
jgi:ribonucleotide reductase alpha subunit